MCASEIKSTSSIPTNTAKDSDFSLKCSMGENDISNLALDKIALVKDGKILEDTKLSFHSIDLLKKDLEDVFTKDTTTYKPNTQFKIKSNNNGLNLVTEKKSIKNDIYKDLKAIGISTFKLEKDIKPIKGEKGDKIVQIQEAYKNNSISDKVSTKTNAHNIVQLKATPNANKAVVKLLLTALTIGFLAGVIGIGGVLPCFGVPYLTALAIPGLSLPVALGLMGAGGLTTASFIALKIASKKSDKAKQYLDAIMLLKSNLFLESNLNDVTNGILFILMTLTMIHAPWFATLQGCFAYPTGALLLGSGIYQLGESIKSAINSRKIKDNKEMIVSILNVLCSSTVIAMGVLTMIGLINSPITVGVMLAFGALVVTVNAYSLYKSFNQYKVINKVDKNDPIDIVKFLKNQLSLNIDEIKKIKDKIDKMKADEFISWITKNKKNFEEEQAKIFNKIKKQLIKAQADNDENKKLEILKDMKKIMLIEEIKNATESKIEGFGSIASKETLLKTLENFDKFKKDPQMHKDDLIKLFSNIKKETTRKTIAEAFKFGVINVPLMIFPFLKIFSLINLVIYDLLMAAELVANISVNITPKYRNIPPAMIKEVLDINNTLGTEEYLKYKNMLKKYRDSASEKTKKVALEEKIAS